MFSPERTITVLTTDGGRIQLGEAAARRSRRLAIWLNINQERVEIPLAELTSAPAAWRSSQIQALAELMQPQSTKGDDDSWTLDDMHDGLIGRLLHRMEVSEVSQLLTTCAQLKCAALLQTLVGYCMFAIPEAITPSLAELALGTMLQPHHEQQRMQAQAVNGRVTLIAINDGHVYLSKAAARHSRKLAARLDEQPAEHAFAVTDLTPEAGKLTPDALQHLVEMLEHFVTTPYPTLAAKCPPVATFDLVAGQWVGERLRRMPMQMFLRLQIACEELECNRLMPIINQYAAYRLYSAEKSMPAADRGNTNKLIAKIEDDSFVTP